MFSNLSAKLGGTGAGGGMPLFLLATGIGIGICLPFLPEQAHWTGAAVAELAYLALVSTFVAAAFWEKAMRHGNVVLVASVSYFTPLLSTMMCAFLLKIRPGAHLWFACLLSIAGAWICKRSIVSRADETR
jgi:drug/metabolite transporter (DMT)-like permease